MLSKVTVQIAARRVRCRFPLRSGGNGIQSLLCCRRGCRSDSHKLTFLNRDNSVHGLRRSQIDRGQRGTIRRRTQHFAAQHLLGGQIGGELMRTSYEFTQPRSHRRFAKYLPLGDWCECDALGYWPIQPAGQVFALG